MLYPQHRRKDLQVTLGDLNLSGANELNQFNRYFFTYWTTNSQHLHSFWTTDLSGTIPNSVKFEWKANQEQFCKALLTWLSSFSHSVQGYDMVIIFLKSFYLNHYTGTAHEIALTTSHEDRSYSKHVWFILNMGFQTADTEYTQAIIHWYKIK